MAEEGKENQGTEGEELLAGRFKSTEDLEKGYTELESKLGQQGEELGSSRKQVDTLVEQLESMKPPEKTNEGQDASTKLDSLIEQARGGEIDLADAILEASKYSSEMGAERAINQFQELQEQQQVEASKTKFEEDNPGFTEFVEAGEAEKVKSAYPGLHDNFSAWFQYKADLAAQEAYEKGKNEGMEVAQGDKATGNVLPGEGSDHQMQQLGEGNKPLSEKEFIDGMKQALDSYRKGG